MTKKENIALLKEIRDNGELSLTQDQKTAIDEAIKRIKKEQVYDAVMLLKQLLTAAAHIYNKK